MLEAAVEVHVELGLESFAEVELVMEPWERPQRLYYLE